MLQSLKSKKLTKILGISSALLLTGCAVGISYYFTSTTNPYTNFYKRPTNYGDDALSQVYLSALHSGADILIGAGFAHQNVISTLSGNKQYQHEAFIGVDIFYSGQHGQNVCVANFKTEQSGFFAAIAAAEYLNQNQSFFINETSKHLSYSMWGGLPVDSVNSYLVGFQQGMIYYNTKILPILKSNKILTNENKEYQQIYMTCAPKFYADGFDPNNGDAIIENLLYKNTKTYDVENNKLISTGELPSIIFPVAGPQTGTLVTKIYNENLKIAVVGVDTAMEDDLTMNREYRLNKLPILNGKPNKNIIAFSAIKDIQESVNKILQNIYNGVTEPANKDDFGGLGYSSIGTIKNNGAGISQSGYESLINICMKSNLINNSYDDVKKYFSTTFDISDTNNLKPTIIYWENGVYTKKDIILYGESSWLNAPNQNIDEFKKEANKFAQYMSNKLKSYDKKQTLDTVKIILATPNTVLFDNSFAENVYLGLHDYFKYLGINIPLPK